MADRDTLKQINTAVSQTRRKLIWLEIGRAFWPFYVLVFLFLGIAIAGVFERAPAALAAVMSLFGIIGGAILFWRGWKRFRRVSREEAEQALDRQSELRPLSSLTDRPAKPGREARLLWTRHRERLIEAIRSLEPPSLLKAWRALDPVWLRAALPAAVVALALLAGPQTWSRIQGAFQPDLGALVGADQMVVEAWITPPAHTGRAPIFLKAGLDGIVVPQGSEITLRTKAHSAPKLKIRGDDRRNLKFELMPDESYEVRTTLREDSRVSVHWWGERIAWDIRASDDLPPEIQFVSLPLLGSRDFTEFSWVASDDYGIDRVELAIRLKEPNPEDPDAEDRAPVPVPGVKPVEAKDETALDLTRHRWAGLDVDVAIVAIDGAGQEGRSETVTFVLPEKLFLEPYARAAQEVRVTVLREPRDYPVLEDANVGALEQDALNLDAINRLNIAPPDVQKAALMLDSLTLDAHNYIQDRTYFLALRTAHGILKSASTKQDAHSIDTLLWTAALKAEYGSAADALRRLLAAQKALEQALRDSASEEEIRRRMEAFKDAANDYLAARMAEALANGLDSPQSTEDTAMGPSGPSVGGQDFEDMLKALEDLTETGASDQARQLLADISNMLQNLEFQEGNGQGKGLPGLPGENAESEELPEDEQELTEAMKRLSDILREQRELNDDTLAQERGETPQAGQQPGEQGENGETGEGEQAGEGEQPGEGEQAGGSGGSLPQPGSEPGSEGGAGGQSPTDQAGQDGAGGTELGEEDGQGGTQFGESDDTTGGQSGEVSPETLAERQRRLGELIDELGRGEGIGENAEGNSLFGDTDQEALEKIERAQRRAAEALEGGNERRAARNQEFATELLSELNRDLAKELDDLQASRDPDAARNAAATDPFGRPMGSANSGEDVNVPDLSERQRAKDILDELRQRFEDAETDEEREYLERLLDRF